MEQLIKFLAEYKEYLIPLAILAIETLINSLSRHFTEKDSSWAKVFFGLSEFFSVVTSKGAYWTKNPSILGKIKLPIMSVKPRENPNEKDCRDADNFEDFDSGKGLGMVIPWVLIGGALLSLGLTGSTIGCASVETKLKQVHASTAAVRLEGTAFFDARCAEEVEKCKAIKKKPCTAEECPNVMECRAQRNAFYAATNGIQLSTATGLQMDAAGNSKEAKAILIAVVAASAELYQKLKEYHVITDALNAIKAMGKKEDKDVKQPSPVPAPVPTPTPTPISAPAMKAPASQPIK